MSTIMQTFLVLGCLQVETVSLCISVNIDHMLDTFKKQRISENSKFSSWSSILSDSNSIYVIHIHRGFVLSASLLWFEALGQIFIRSNHAFFFSHIYTKNGRDIFCDSPSQNFQHKWLILTEVELSLFCYIWIALQLQIGKSS